MYKVIKVATQEILMHRDIFCLKILTLFISLGLILPNPAWALRSLELSENPKGLTGLEEALLGKTAIDISRLQKTPAAIDATGLEEGNLAERIEFETVEALVSYLQENQPRRVPHKPKEGRGIHFKTHFYPDLSLVEKTTRGKWSKHSLRLAQERLGDLTAAFVVREPEPTPWFLLPLAILPKPTHLYMEFIQPLDEVLLDQVKVGRIAQAQGLLRQYHEITLEIIRRGVLNWDPRLDNYGVTPSGEVRLLDLGGLVETESALKETGGEWDMTSIQDFSVYINSGVPRELSDYADELEGEFGFKNSSQSSQTIQAHQGTAAPVRVEWKPAIVIAAGGLEQRAPAQKWDEETSSSIRDELIRFFNEELLDKLRSSASELGFRQHRSSHILLDEYRSSGVKQNPLTFSSKEEPESSTETSIQYGFENWVGGPDGWPNFFVRVGPFFFLEEKRAGELPSELRSQLGSNLILVNDLSRSTIGSNPFYYSSVDAGRFSHQTATAMTAMLHGDFSGMRVVDAGTDDGMLLLVAGALGAEYLEGFDISAKGLEKARANLILNGYEGRFNLFEADLREPENVVRQLSQTELETALISNIGGTQPIYEVTNADSIGLIPRIREETGSEVTLFVGAGHAFPSRLVTFAARRLGFLVPYRKLLLAHPQELSDQQELIRTHGFSTEPERLGTYTTRKTRSRLVAWAATRDLGQSGAAAGLEETAQAAVSAAKATVSEYLASETVTEEAAVFERLRAARTLKRLVRRGVDGPVRVEVDLQMHTFHSDGYATPTDIVYEAYRKGLRAIAITDHQTLAGIPEAMEAGKIFEVEVIPGVELDTDVSGLEILGFLPQITTPAQMQALIDSGALQGIAVTQQGHITRAEELLQRTNASLPDMPLTQQDLIPYRRSGPLLAGNVYSAFRDKYGVQIKDVLKQRGADWTTGDIQPEGWDRSPIAIVRLLRVIGAVPVWAHPAEVMQRQEWSLSRFAEELVPIAEAGLLGIEIAAQSNTPELIEGLPELLKQHNQRYPELQLFGSVGSDTHGQFQPSRVMGLGKVNGTNPTGNLVPELGTYAVVDAVRSAYNASANQDLRRAAIPASPALLVTSGGLEERSNHWASPQEIQQRAFNFQTTFSFLVRPLLFEEQAEGVPLPTLFRWMLEGRHGNPAARFASAVNFTESDLQGLLYMPLSGMRPPNTTDVLSADQIKLLFMWEEVFGALHRLYRDTESVTFSDEMVMEELRTYETNMRGRVNETIMETDAPETGQRFTSSDFLDENEWADMDDVPVEIMVIMARTMVEGTLTERGAGGLEENLPDPINFFSHSEMVMPSHMTYLNRDLKLIPIIENQVLPDLIQRNQADRTIQFAFLGTSTGDEIARIWHHTARWLEEQGHSLRGDPGQRWTLRFYAVDLSGEMLARAQDRFSGEEPFSYMYSDSMDIPSRDIEAEIKEYARAIVDTVERDSDLISAGGITWIEGDMTESTVVDQVRGADLYIANTPNNNEIDPDRLHGMWETFLGNSQAWAMSTNLNWGPQGEPSRTTLDIDESVPLPELNPDESQKNYVVSMPGQTPVVGLEEQATPGTLTQWITRYQNLGSLGATYFDGLGQVNLIRGQGDAAPTALFEPLLSDRNANNRAILVPVQASRDSERLVVWTQPELRLPANLAENTTLRRLSTSTGQARIELQSANLSHLVLLNRASGLEEGQAAWSGLLSDLELVGIALLPGALEGLTQDDLPTILSIARASGGSLYILGITAVEIEGERHLLLFV